MASSLKDPAKISRDELVCMLTDARARTLALVADLNDEQMIGPRLTTVNPPLWEIGHVAWFQEFWVLRHLRKQRPILEAGDALYNSTEVAHDTRWELLLPTREETLNYMQLVLDRTMSQLSTEPTTEETYFYRLATFHEDMHDEAITYTRQTLGYPVPKLTNSSAQVAADTRGGALRGDVEISGGTLILGASPDLPFVFDNEKWAHPVKVKPFRIARAPVTNGEFAAFVDDGGYRRKDLWTGDGWHWLQSGGRLTALEQSFSRFWSKDLRAASDRATGEAIEHPVYWHREASGRWRERIFDQREALNSSLPVVHVSWYEAEAYCRWAGRRLPAEAEWECAAAVDPTADPKRLFPWGSEPPGPERANLEGITLGRVEVGALPAGDSAFGCRQMIGNVWEWTADEFQPYPGFVADPYKEYSQPWFGTHKVLRGGCWVTRARLIRNTWRNFYTPDRRDVWAGFRTCALRP